MQPETAPPATDIISETYADAREHVGASLRILAAAWNAGDLETALSFYWDGPDMRWVSPTGTETGLESYAASMRREFEDRSTMGRFSGTVLYAEQLRPDLVLAVFSWRIERQGKRDAGGVSTQIWQNIHGRWRIVFEHAG
jgi:ketosteroid isomerase-like protein